MSQPKGAKEMSESEHPVDGAVAGREPAVNAPRTAVSIVVDLLATVEFGTRARSRCLRVWPHLGPTSP